MSLPEFNSSPNAIEISIGTATSFGSLALPYIEGPDGIKVLDGTELRELLNDLHAKNPDESPLVFITPLAITRSADTINEEERRKGSITFYGGQLEIRPKERQVYYDGKPTEPLTLVEFSLLHTLASQPGVARTRAYLLNAVWQNRTGIDTRNVDAYVRRVREKTITGAIETVRGIGYRAAV